MDAKTEQYRRVRGAMLKVLAGEHPRPVDAEVVRALIDELGFPLKEAEIRGHLLYLADKGYVKVDVKKASGVEIEMTAITPAGLDLLDGFTEDVGVDVRFG